MIGYVGGRTSDYIMKFVSERSVVNKGAREERNNYEDSWKDIEESWKRKKEENKKEVHRLCIRFIYKCSFLL